MTCSVCGSPYPCLHGQSLDPDNEDTRAKGLSSQHQDQLYWRQEVISRVAQHRARRRRRADPNASLALAFPDETPSELPGLGREIVPAPAGLPSVKPPKIIRFPRMAPVPTAEELASAPSSDELAQDPPRILDAPEAEQMELLPSYAGIRLDEDEEHEDETAWSQGTRNRSKPGSSPEQGFQHDMDLPPQPASVSRRVASALIDAVVLFMAVGAFGLTFTELSKAALRPRVMLLSAMAVSVALGALFQFIFLVYGRGTPGMRSAGLELCTFDGSAPAGFSRQSRVLAEVLSVLSLGLGFAWVLVDEDTLGWHDRISGTYLRSSTQRSSVSTQPI
jgi:uncharacterized RDD family membrane protein YckC